jgi:hypothetical protein
MPKLRPRIAVASLSRSAGLLLGRLAGSFQSARVLSKTSTVFPGVNWRSQKLPPRIEAVTQVSVSAAPA